TGRCGEAEGEGADAGRGEEAAGRSGRGVHGERTSRTTSSIGTATRPRTGWVRGARGGGGRLQVCCGPHHSRSSTSADGQRSCHLLLALGPVRHAVTKSAVGAGGGRRSPALGGRALPRN